MIIQKTNKSTRCRDSPKKVAMNNVINKLQICVEYYNLEADSYDVPYDESFGGNMLKTFDKIQMNVMDHRKKEWDALIEQPGMSDDSTTMYAATVPLVEATKRLQTLRMTFTFFVSHTESSLKVVSIDDDLISSVSIDDYLILLTKNFVLSTIISSMTVVFKLHSEQSGAADIPFSKTSAVSISVEIFKLITSLMLFFKNENVLSVDAPIGELLDQIKTTGDADAVYKQLAGQQQPPQPRIEQDWQQTYWNVEVRRLRTSLTKLFGPTLPQDIIATLNILADNTTSHNQKVTIYNRKVNEYKTRSPQSKTQTYADLLVEKMKPNDDAVNIPDQRFIEIIETLHIHENENMSRTNAIIIDGRARSLRIEAEDLQYKIQDAKDEIRHLFQDASDEFIAHMFEPVDYGLQAYYELVDGTIESLQTIIYNTDFTTVDLTDTYENIIYDAGEDLIKMKAFAQSIRAEYKKKMTEEYKKTQKNLATQTKKIQTNYKRIKDKERDILDALKKANQQLLKRLEDFDIPSRDTFKPEYPQSQVGPNLTYEEKRRELEKLRQERFKKVIDQWSSSSNRDNSGNNNNNSNNNGSRSQSGNTGNNNRKNSGSSSQSINNTTAERKREYNIITDYKGDCVVQ